MPSFSLAGPAEIVRAKQKDDIYKDRLQKLWLDVLLKGAGTKLWLRFRTFPVGHFLYGAATTLLGLQTLGEEYTGIVQVDSSQVAVPSFLNRLVMLGLDNFGSLVIIYILNRLDKFVRSNPHIHQEAKNDVLETIRVLKALLPFLERLHKTIFYCGGFYYQISKRFTSIHYVLVRRWLKDYQSLYGFRMLGYVTAIHLFGVAAYTSWRWLNLDKSLETGVEEVTSPSVTGRKCPLCLEERRGVSATPCGHLFCWSCILNWLQTSNQCPICRERVEPSRVVPLQNYI